MSTKPTALSPEASKGQTLEEETKKEQEIVPEEIQKIRERIKAEKEKSDKIDEQIAAVQKQIIEEKDKMKGVTPQEKHSKLVKEIKQYEHKLDKLNQKYNETVANNKKLREDIDSLRRERLVFEQIYK